MTPAHRADPSFSATLILASIVCLPFAGCGYMVGGAYRKDIQTVHVPIFQNTGFRRDIEFQLTEAVHREIQNQTHFRLAKAGEADTRLTGRIVSIRKHALSESGFDDARELQLNLTVEVTWEDLRGNKQVMPTKQIEIPPDVIKLLSSADFAPELGQSKATARQRAVNNLARQIVQLMQTPW
jgi:outer membrane lipopolysaccharide assembly protein LptE/RlpB